jgi:tetratricopeptide (TPR) repeat protein
VESGGDRPTLSDVVLGFGSELMLEASGPRELKTFQVGSALVHPSAGNVFVIGDTIHAFFQVLGAGPEDQLHFALLNGEEKVQERSTQASAYYDGTVIERFQLTDMVGGRYLFRVELVDSSGRIVAERSAPVQLSPRSEIARPWTYRQSFDTTQLGSVELWRGDQLLALKRLAEARQEFERAVAVNPELAEARWRLAGAFLGSGEDDRALELFADLEEDFPNQFEVVAGLGVAYYLKQDFAKAVSYLTRAMEIRFPDASLLNALADSHFQLGELEEASELFRRSLEVDSEQPAIEERITALEESK